MKKISRLAFIGIISLLMSGCCGYISGNRASAAGGASDGYMQVQNVKYRKGGAHRAFLGAIGIVREKNGNAFESRDSSPKELDGLEVHQIASLNISAEGGVDDGANTKTSNSGELNFFFNKKLNEEGSFDIFQVLNTEELINTLNKEKNKKLLETISKSEDYRIITSILVFSNHKKFRRISGNPNISLKLLNKESRGKPSLEAGTKLRNKKIRRKERIAFSDGMIIGYEYSRFCWEKTENGWKIADLPVDQPGFDAYCPAGSNYVVEPSLPVKPSSPVKPSPPPRRVCEKDELASVLSAAASFPRGLPVLALSASASFSFLAYLS